MSSDSWNHRLARLYVRPLVRTGVTPNHITTLRLLTGLAASAALAVGDAVWSNWGGVLWLVSAQLDRADGELARLAGKSSQWGHRYDFVSDMVVLAAFFIGAGIGLRGSMLGYWSIPMGVVAGISAAACTSMAESFTNRTGGGAKIYPSRWGFDFDDIMMLFAPVVWLGWLMYFVAGASVGAPIFVLLTVFLMRSRRERGTKTT